ncbi:MAG TPA: ABC transporter permease [Candidatus Limnocylindrales bacterium]|nr:ABC transporter permease [Candidatus Limnocylindrales bacterium]
MGRLLVRRLLFMAFVLWGVSLFTFFLARVAPGDPARLIAGPHANAEAIANVRALYGLDQPLPVQYVHYLVGLLHGDFGTSYVTRRPVLTDLVTFLPATLELSFYALLVGSLVGLGLGVMSALRAGSNRDKAARFVAVAGLSMPAFWLAILLQLVFYSALRALPLANRLDTGMAAPPQVTGFMTIDSLLSGQWATFAAAVRHLILPVLTLSLAEVGLMARVVRTSVLEVVGADCIRTAEAKGLKPRRVLTRHTLRNALLPAVTIVGLEAALLAGGVFLVEEIFAWPGVGRYAFDAIRSSDYNAIMGFTVIGAVFYVVVNLVVDLLYLRLDPRIRYT